MFNQSKPFTSNVFGQNQQTTSFGCEYIFELNNVMQLKNLKI